jgi:hypothetical protein
VRVPTAIAVVAVLASVAVSPAWSAGGARNLAATPKVKAALRRAFIRIHSNLTARSIRGPLRGRTYYGSYQRREYAVAVFSIPRLGTQDQPEVFRRPTAGVWRDLGDTGGDICPPTIPLPLLKVWNFHVRARTRATAGRSSAMRLATKHR